MKIKTKEALLKAFSFKPEINIIPYFEDDDSFSSDEIEVLKSSSYKRYIRNLNARIGESDCDVRLELINDDYLILDNKYNPSKDESNITINSKNVTKVDKELFWENYSPSYDSLIEHELPSTWIIK
jgi:hypothetical protein